jgi:uncharacterized membrane protein YphA (DoxX/SURF4 family)
MKLITGISRVFVGLLFIFSGLIKANDPVGFSYKLSEYYSIFGTGFLQNGVVLQAVLICVLEIILGVCVLIGTRMKITSWLLMGMIVFFTFLTGFTAISNWFWENPTHSRTHWFEEAFGFQARSLYYMKDCGCFGDAIKLTPWQSFYKDLVLLVLISIIFIRRKAIRPFFARIMQTNIILFFTLISAIFSITCWMYTPAVNFLKWKKGNNILALMESVPPQIDFVFIYEKDGSTFKFKADELPENIADYTYAGREETVIDPGKQAGIADFAIRTRDGRDITQEVLRSDAYTLFVVAYDLDKSREKSFRKFSPVARGWQEKGYSIYGFTSSYEAETEALRHEHQLPFEFYQADQTGLKSIIRSNPGYVLLKKGIVIDQWSSRNTPSLKVLEKAIRRYEKKQGK